MVLSVDLLALLTSFFAVGIAVIIKPQNAKFKVDLWARLLIFAVVVVAGAFAGLMFGQIFLFEICQLIGWQAFGSASSDRPIQAFVNGLYVMQFLIEFLATTAFFWLRSKVEMTS